MSVTGSKTIVYVDGFNLYYGALKRTACRWLDLEKFFRFVFPQNDILGIRYFTAVINPLPGDPDQPLRQKLYLRALATRPMISLVKGHYLCHPKSMPLVTPDSYGRRFADVLFTEEKGSDVNLASHLLMDGFRDRYESAIVVSGDSDLATPITMVQQELGKKVGVLLPQRLLNSPDFKPRKSAKLKSVAAFFREGIREGVLAASQFPAELHDAHGTFHKPSSW
jgi:uncharacterized LabA/DUF88 family protein